MPLVSVTLMQSLLPIEGLWKQVRVDHGMELISVVAIQRHLASLQQHHHVPILQTICQIIGV